MHSARSRQAFHFALSQENYPLNPIFSSLKVRVFSGLLKGADLPQPVSSLGCLPNPLLRLVESQELFFFLLKPAGVHPSAPISDLRLMLHMQHLVEHQEVQDMRRNTRVVEMSVDDDGMLQAVVFTKLRFQAFLTPAQKGNFQSPSEVHPVHAIKDFSQILMAAARKMSPTSFRLTWREKQAEARSILLRVLMIPVKRFQRSFMLIESRKKNLTYRFQDIRRCASKNMGKADLKNTFSKPDSVGQRAVMKIRDVKSRERGRGIPVAIDFIEYPNLPCHDSSAFFASSPA